MKIALLLSALLFLAATLLLLSGLLDQHRRARQVALRLDGKPLSDHRVSHWLQLLGDSRIGQRSIQLDNEPRPCSTASAGAAPDNARCSPPARSAHRCWRWPCAC